MLKYALIILQLMSVHSLVVPQAPPLPVGHAAIIPTTIQSESEAKSSTDGASNMCICKIAGTKCTNGKIADFEITNDGVSSIIYHDMTYECEKAEWICSTASPTRDMKIWSGFFNYEGGNLFKFNMVTKKDFNSIWATMATGSPFYETIVEDDPTNLFMQEPLAPSLLNSAINEYHQRLLYQAENSIDSEALIFTLRQDLFGPSCETAKFF